MTPPSSAPLLIVGRSGQVASAFRRLAPQLSTVRPLCALGRSVLDLASSDFYHNFDAVLEQYGPAVVINAAAYTAVDRAEVEPELSHQVNGDAVGLMARACGGKGIPFIHLSTDYVFDGRGDRPWQPTDRPAPLGVYGASKLSGELQIRAAAEEQGTRALVLRVSWVFGQQGSNFVRTMLRLAGERSEIRVVADQVGGPTSADSIAAALFQLVEAALANRAPVAPHSDPFPWGIHHFQGQPWLSWYNFADVILSEAHSLGLIQAQPQLIPISTAEYPMKALRPCNSRLNCSSSITQLGLQLPEWQQDIAPCLLSAGTS